MFLYYFQLTFNHGEQNVIGGFGSAPADPAAAAANANAVVGAIASAGVNTGNVGGV